MLVDLLRQYRRKLCCPRSWLYFVIHELCIFIKLLLRLMYAGGPVRIGP
jgi:hypothetical protein